MTERYCEHGYLKGKRCPQCRPSKRRRAPQRTDHDLAVVRPEYSDADEERIARRVEALGIPFRHR